MSLFNFIILGLALLFCEFSFAIHFPTKDNNRKIYTFYFRIASSLYSFSVLFSLLAFIPYRIFRSVDIICSPLTFAVDCPSSFAQ